MPWYGMTALFVYLTWANHNPWWIVGWLLFNVALIPLCLWLHRWNHRQNAKMLEEFPYDPEIQRKYGKYRDE